MVKVYGTRGDNKCKHEVTSTQNLFTVKCTLSSDKLNKSVSFDRPKRLWKAVAGDTVILSVSRNIHFKDQDDYVTYTDTDGYIDNIRISKYTGNYSNFYVECTPKESVASRIQSIDIYITFLITTPIDAAY